MSYWNRRTLKCNDQNLMKELAQAFLSEKPKRTVYGNFRIEDDRLLYKSQSQRSCWTKESKVELAKRVAKGEARILPGFADASVADERKVEYIDYDVTVVALKIPQANSPKLIIGNSSILPQIGKTVAYGNETLNREQTEIQKQLALLVPMIPFSVFQEANLDLMKLKLVQQGSAETIVRKVPNPNHGYSSSKKVPEYIEQTVHFTGASLFTIEGRTFLFDVDRREIQHKIFNPFLSEIPAKVKTIAEAYAALKPKLVVQAEARGQKVLRQGEWFFIPAKAPRLPKLTQSQKLLVMMGEGQLFNRAEEHFSNLFGKSFVKGLARRGTALGKLLPKPTTLKAGENRPNTATLGLTVKGKTFVSGKVSHSGREHADLKLDGWYLAIPNTATKSFTITGDID